MPQFCILFYAIIQSWRPKVGAMAQWPPPKYVPDKEAKLRQKTWTFLEKILIYYFYVSTNCGSVERGPRGKSQTSAMPSSLIPSTALLGSSGYSLQSNTLG